MDQRNWGAFGDELTFIIACAIDKRANSGERFDIHNRAAAINQAKAVQEALKDEGYNINKE